MGSLAPEPVLVSPTLYCPLTKDSQGACAQPQLDVRAQGRACCTERLFKGLFHLLTLETQELTSPLLID